MRIKKLLIALNKKSRKMLALKFAFCAGLITLVCFPALATGTMSYKVMIQNTGVKGKIVDKSGLPLPGVSIKLKNTNIGTVSDINGNYIINAVDNNAILVFSYLGFETQEIAVNNRTDINITLLEDLKALQEVVVIGYQTIRKKDITGSSSSVDVVNTEKLVARSMPEALQGMTPGVAVRNGGAPGQEAVVNIRGLATFGNASPLFSYFSKCFAQQFKLTPTEFADQHKTITT